MKVQEGYKYSIKPRSLPRALLATWRVLKDPDNLDANVYEAAIVEMYFNRSRFGKRIARWDLLAKEVAETHSEAAEAMHMKRRIKRVDLEALLKMPEGSFGNTFAKMSMERGVDPNLVEPMPGDTDGDWLMAHLYETHDFWHVLTGNYFDMNGEFGIAGVYLGQMPRFSFIAFFMSLLTLQHVWKKREALGDVFEAFNKGYTIGKNAKCLVGLDWETLYHRDLDELRAELCIEDAGMFPRELAEAA